MMKNICLAAGILCMASGLFAQEVQPPMTEQASAGPQTVKAAKLVPAQKTVQAQPLTPEEQKERFDARNKEIRKLTKRYRKTKSEEEKAQIKEQLSEIVSEATDEGIAWSKERIAATRADMDRWEKMIQEQEANLEQIKDRRVDDILSGEAERRHKLAQKRWKQEMKDRKKWMK